MTVVCLLGLDELLLSVLNDDKVLRSLLGDAPMSRTCSSVFILRPLPYFKASVSVERWPRALRFWTVDTEDTTGWVALPQVSRFPGPDADLRCFPFAILGSFGQLEEEWLWSSGKWKPNVSVRISSKVSS